MLSFANLSISILFPLSSKSTEAFLFGPAPSTVITVPAPNFWWKTRCPAIISDASAVLMLTLCATGCRCCAGLVAVVPLWLSLMVLVHELLLLLNGL